VEASRAVVTVGIEDQIAPGGKRWPGWKDNLSGLARVVRESADESSATRFFGSLTAESLDPVREVERALRADGQLDDEDVRRVMQAYLEARRTTPRAERRRRRAAS